MTGWSDEVKAGMNTEVDPVSSAWLLFLQHVRLMLIVQELYDGHPRVTVVDVVAEARSVDDRQADCPMSCFRICILIIYADEDHTLEEFLFQFRLGNLNLNSLVYLLRMAAPMVCVVLDSCRE